MNVSGVDCIPSEVSFSGSSSRVRVTELRLVEALVVILAACAQFVSRRRGMGCTNDDSSLVHSRTEDEGMVHVEARQHRAYLLVTLMGGKERSRG